MVSSDIKFLELNPFGFFLQKILGNIFHVEILNLCIMYGTLVYTT